jgi:hypothetical protein
MSLTWISSFPQGFSAIHRPGRTRRRRITIYCTSSCGCAGQRSHRSTGPETAPHCPFVRCETRHPRPSSGLGTGMTRVLSRRGGVSSRATDVISRSDIAPRVLERDGSEKSFGQAPPPGYTTGNERTADKVGRVLQSRVLEGRKFKDTAYAMGSRSVWMRSHLSEKLVPQCWESL